MLDAQYSTTKDFLNDFFSFISYKPLRELIIKYATRDVETYNEQEDIIERIDFTSFPPSEYLKKVYGEDTEISLSTTHEFYSTKSLSTIYQIFLHGFYVSQGIIFTLPVRMAITRIVREILRKIPRERFIDSLMEHISNNYSFTRERHEFNVRLGNVKREKVDVIVEKPKLLKDGIYTRMFEDKNYLLISDTTLQNYINRFVREDIFNYMTEITLTTFNSRTIKQLSIKKFGEVYAEKIINMRFPKIPFTFSSPPIQMSLFDMERDKKMHHEIFEVRKT